MRNAKIQNLMDELTAVTTGPHQGTNYDWSIIAEIVIEELIRRNYVSVNIPNIDPKRLEYFPVSSVQHTLVGLTLGITTELLILQPDQTEAVRNSPTNAANQLRDKLRAKGSRRVVDQPDES